MRVNYNTQPTTMSTLAMLFRKYFLPPQVSSSNIHNITHHLHTHSFPWSKPTSNGTLALHLRLTLFHSISRLGTIDSSWRSERRRRRRTSRHWMPSRPSDNQQGGHRPSLTRKRNATQCSPRTTHRPSLEVKTTALEDPNIGKSLLDR